MEDIKLTKLTECSGCGAKVGAGELVKLLSDLKVNHDDNLLVGYDRSDDAAVYRISDELAMVQTLDFFPPIADDPYTFGAIAATNALSDIYAMGGEPRTALNIMAVPEDMPSDAVHEILRGGYDKVYEAGAVIAGGHSIYDKEPKYGMAVTGFVDPRRILTNAGAMPGDVLIYTKPVGIGIMTTAEKGGLLGDDEIAYIEKLMMTLNKYPRDIMVKYQVHACTDVTGFGMLGHLFEMAEGSDTEIELTTSKITFIEGAENFAELGILPKGVYRNRHYAEHAVDAGDVDVSIQDMLYDPQTSGGLMISVAEADADALEAELRADDRIPCVQRVGKVMEAGTHKEASGKRIFLFG